LRLSLVTCPVALFPATSDSEKISFNQVNRNTGHRIKYMKVDADTGEEVFNEDIMKGNTLIAFPDAGIEGGGEQRPHQVGHEQERCRAVELPSGDDGRRQHDIERKDGHQTAEHLVATEKDGRPGRVQSQL